MGKRLTCIDSIKGLTIFLVVLGHAFQGTIDSLHITVNSSESAIWYAKQMIYSFHMPLFFFIAGLFITKNKERSIYSFFKSKLFRIILPYFIWSFIVACIMQIASRYTNGGLGLYDFLLSPIKPFSQYWFLYDLFFILMVYKVLIRLLRERGPFLLLLLGGVLILIHPIVPDVWILRDYTYYFFFFSLGAYGLNIINRLSDMPIFSIANLILLLSIWITTIIGKIYFSLFPSVYGTVLFAIWGSFVYIYIALALEKLCPQANSLLQFWGKKSMEIYCMHLIILAGMRIFLFKILHSPYVWGNILIMMIITMFALDRMLRQSKYENTVMTYFFGNKKEV